MTLTRRRPHVRAPPPERSGGSGGKQTDRTAIGARQWTRTETLITERVLLGFRADDEAGTHNGRNNPNNALADARVSWEVNL